MTMHAPASPAIEAGVMPVLRDSTADLHQAAEQSAFQQALVRGVLPREQYVNWLGQMLHLHRALETALRSAQSTGGPVARVVHAWQFQEPRLLEDLKFFGAGEPGEALPSVREFARWASVADGVELLGAHYVLEGSKNGGRYIAKGVRRAYALASDDGARHLDPYGEAQRERWAEFKAAMSAEQFSAGDTARMVEAARRMFRTVTQLGDELAAA
jgi:heme oxygenase